MRNSELGSLSSTANGISRVLGSGIARVVSFTQVTKFTIGNPEVYFKDTACEFLSRAKQLCVPLLD